MSDSANVHRHQLNGAAPVCESMREPKAGSVTVHSPAAAPFRADGAETDRAADGRFQRGNRAALIVGARSAAFWASQHDARQAFIAGILSDHGCAPDDAPAALMAAADGLAQAVLLRDSAFHRIAESGGPTSLRGRRRAALSVWLDASDRFEKLIRVLGVERRQKPAPSVRDYMARAAEGR